MRASTTIELLLRTRADTCARLALPALLALLTGCAGRATAPEADAPSAADPPSVSVVALDEVVPARDLPPDQPRGLARAATLGGQPLTESTDGPWALRRGPGSRHAESGADGALVMKASPPSSVPPGRVSVDTLAREDAAVTPPAEPRVPPADAGPLRAGSTDDNARFGDFLEYLRGWNERADRQEFAEQFFVPIDVLDRRFIEVVDGTGDPLPAARVRLVDEAGDRIVWSATTYGDGRAPYYPGLAGLGAEPPPLLVEVRHGETHTLRRWDGGDEHVVIRLDTPAPTTAPSIRLDVLFLIDTTGSMGDEIARVKATLLRVTERLRALEQEFDLRYGAVLYRDLNDAYVTKRHPFSGDIAAFAATLQAIEADGGGDTPESLNQGLAEAVGAADWREGAARVCFLIADAPPHLDYADDVPYPASLLAAIDRGIRIHTVAASGLDEQGTLVFRQIAQLTRGRFIFIEYGSAAAAAESHGVRGPVQSNNLDEILFRRLADELAAWGRPTAATRTSRPEEIR